MMVDAPRLEHRHLLDDLRGPLLPTDARSHISRINDWVGSDSWVQGCRKDQPIGGKMTEAYPEPRLPYRLLSAAVHEGALRRAGEIVYVQPSKRGIQHAEVEQVEYPVLAPAVPEPDLPHVVADIAARVAAIEAQLDAMPQPTVIDEHGARLSEVEEKIEAIPRPEIEKHDERLSNLEEKVDALKPSAFVKPSNLD